MSAGDQVQSHVQLLVALPPGHRLSRPRQRPGLGGSVMSSPGPGGRMRSHLFNGGPREFFPHGPLGQCETGALSTISRSASGYAASNAPPARQSWGAPAAPATATRPTTTAPAATPPYEQRKQQGLGLSRGRSQCRPYRRKRRRRADCNVDTALGDAVAVVRIFHAYQLGIALEDGAPLDRVDNAVRQLLQTRGPVGSTDPVTVLARQPHRRDPLQGRRTRW